MYPNIVSNKVKENIILTESGIRMPEGTHSAKVITHKDVDGIFSAIFTVAQLVRQGIPKNRIQIEFAQYGDDKDELYGKTFGKKGQMVSVVDFAALPTGNAFNSLNMIFNYKMDKSKFIEFIKEHQDEFNSYSESEFNKVFLDYFGLKEENLKPKDKINLRDGYRALKHFNFSKVKGMTLGYANLEPYFETKLNTPDFVSDHHDNSKDTLTPGKSGKIGATNFKSDAEHIATVYAQNIADSSTIKAVSVIDSAGYEDLENTVLLSKDFKSKGRLERVATILNSLLPALISHNPDIAKEVIMKSEPSIVSVYNNTIKFGKYNATQLEMYQEMQKETPDWNKINRMKDTLPKRLQKNYTDKDKYKGIIPLKSIEEWREKNQKDIAKALTGYWSPKMEDAYQATKEDGKNKEKALKEFISNADTERKSLGRAKKADPQDIADKRNALAALVEQKTAELEALKGENKNKISTMESDRNSKVGKFDKVGAVMRQDATSLKDYPSRYISSLMEKNGQKAPFVLKRFPTMIQVAVNPYAPKEVKDTVDLGELAKQILDELQAEFKSKGNPDWMMKIIRKESGGHKAITNLSGLGTIGLMPAPERERYNNLVDIKKRVVKIGQKFDKMMPAKKEELDSLQARKDESAKTRVEAMNFIEKRFYEILWQKYHGVKIPSSGKYEIGNVKQVPKDDSKDDSKDEEEGKEE